MQTKLSAFCDKIIEAGWLAAVIVLPILFDVYSEGVFEVAKVCLLRSIVLVMSLAWVISVMEKQEGKQEQKVQIDSTQTLVNLIRRPLVLPVLVLASVYVLTSLTSVWPHVSFWGSYSRRQGTYTALSYMLIFFLIRQALRGRRQIERLIRLIVLASLAVSLYALIQHFGLDPVPWGRDFSKRGTSSLGNPIFTTAYLIMVVPLAMRQLIKSLSELLESRKHFSYHLISVAFYSFILVIQLLCVVFAQSRGPFLGLAGGLFFFFLLLAIYKGRRRVGLTVVALALLLGLVLAILNLRNSPLSALKRVPYVMRLSAIVGATTLKERALTWEGAVEMSRASPVRAIVGYGPETMHVAFSPYLLPGLVDIEGPGWTQDRCHNETLDALVTTGLIGVIAYLFLFGSAFYYGLNCLGLVVSPRQQTSFVALLTMGAVLGVLIPWLLDGTLRFAGVGIPAGMVAALVVYLGTFLFHDRKEKAKHDPNQILLIALFSAIVAHFVEIQSGIAITATRTYFWVYAVLMALIALSIQREPVRVRVLARPLSPKAPSKRSRRRRTRKKAQVRPAGRAVARIADPRRASVLSHSLLIGLLLATTSFDFVTPDFNLRSGFAIVALFLLVWLLGGAIVITEVGEGACSEQDGASWVDSLLVYFAISLACCLIFLLLRTVSLPPSGDPASSVIVYYLYSFIIMVAVAFSLLKGISLPYRFSQKANWCLYAILTTAIGILIFTTNLNVVRADIYFAQGQAYQQAEQLDRSIALYKRALELAPRQDHYYLFLGQAYLRKAQPVTDQRLVWFREAQRALERAREISPLDPDHYANLADLHYHWAEVTSDPAEAAERLKVALPYYQQAMTISPASYGRVLNEDVVSAHCALAMVYQQLGRIDEAVEEARIARNLAPEEEKTKLDALVAWLEAQGG